MPLYPDNMALMQSRLLEGGVILPAYPAPPDGYDIILLIGDSLTDGLNATGSYTTYTRGVNDVDMAGVYQFNGPDASLAGLSTGVINPDITPLWNNKGSVDTTTDRISVGEQIGRSYKTANPINIKNVNRRVLLVNMAKGGSSISDAASGISPGGWAVGQTLYNQAIAQINSALATAKGTLPGSRFVGTWMTLGSNDANSAPVLDPTNFANLMKALVDGLRTDISEGSEAWVVMGGLVPGLSGTDATSVRNGYAAVLAAKTNTYLVIPPGSGVDNLHPAPADLRAEGASAITATASAPEPRMIAPFSIAGQNGVASNTDITSAAVMVRGPGWGQSSTISVTGGTVSVNGGAAATSATVYWGDTFTVTARSSVTAGATATAAVTITGALNAQSANFTLTTLQAGTTNMLYRSSPDPGFVFSNNKILPGAGAGFKESI